MEISLIKQKVDLLKITNNHSYCLLPELSKEIKVSKTDILLFIEQNDKLFEVENIWSTKEVKVKKRLWPNDTKSTYNTTETVRNKNLGLGVRSVFLKPEDNFRTEEWLNKQIVDKEKYLFISESDNYGYIQGYYVPTDTKPDKYRTHLWRNTHQKVEWLRGNGFLSSGSFVYGGFGDSYSNKHDNIITLKKINDLKSIGWTTNDFKPLS